jgi:hypothetical protein
MVVFMSSGDSLIWDGWEISLNDLPRVVQEYHTRSVIIRGARNNVVSYDDAVKLRDALNAAGVKDVQMGSGGFNGG